MELLGALYPPWVNRGINNKLPPFFAGLEQTSVEGSSDIPLPSPNISFHLWTDEDQLCEHLILDIKYG